MEKTKGTAKLLWKLFATFFKIGLFTFGGGYAMLSVVEDECVERLGWISREDMINLVAIAESTPGPMAINCATYTGYRKCGVAGAVCATLGVVLPSFIIIFIISQFFDNFLKYTVVANALKGIRVAVGILIIRAALKLLSSLKKDALSVVLLVLCALTVLLTDVFSVGFSSLWLILFAGAAGLAALLIRSLCLKKSKGGDAR